MTKGMDCAVSTVGKAHGIKASGIDFVARYYPTGLKKSLTRQEAEGLKSAGLWIVSVFELNPTESAYFAGGRTRGVEDGEKALESAKACGQPVGSVIYFTVDYDAGEDDLEAIQAYFEGVRSILMPHYLVGVYGSGRVCRAIQGAGLAHCSWLAMSRGWSGSEDYHDWSLCQTVEGCVKGIAEDGDVSRGNAGGWQPQ
ncbi:MAG TPA: DUF1906 domain-containing protein [Chthonomonadaceae bacterium]|nr:DUF1906 domain-containing protein [Chthonomonadaceae bacterium]